MATRISYFPLEMEVAPQILRNSLQDATLDNLVSRVITITIIPFMMITAFEGLVINGSKLFLNVCILIANAFLSLWPQEQEVIILPPAPALEELELLIQDAEVKMPVAAEEDKQRVYEIFTTLANTKYLKMMANPSMVSRLNTLDDELTPVHPFQFLEAIFGKDSIIKDCMPSVLDSYGTRKGTVDGLKRGLARPEHRAKFWEYLPNFAKSVGISKEMASSFLHPTQDWIGLLRHLESIHCK